MIKPAIGDVIEVKTKNGLRYAQYTHLHKRYGALLRILPGVYPGRPTSFEDVVKLPTLFFCFFPLRAALNRDIFLIVSNLPVPAFAREFPMFRAGVVDPISRRVQTWWLWNGETEVLVGALTNEQRSLSIRGIWNDTLLIERLESGWTPETDRS